MPLIIDGHNLIPKIPGLSLEELDDEIQLIQLLQGFSRIRRVQVECYFDKAPQGYNRAQRFGMVMVKFARSGKTADDEIKGRLSRLKREAKNWTVISSDLRVQAAARTYGARIQAAEVFASEMLTTLKRASELKGMGTDRELSPDEVELWLKEFRGRQSRD